MSFTAIEAGYAIIEAALEFAGLHEIQNNVAWSDPVLSAKLQTKLKEVGWQPGWAYCASFVEMAWLNGYRNVGATKPMLTLLQKVLTPSVMTSFTNAKKYALSKDPKPGSIFFMQKGSAWLGHEGIILGGGGGAIATIEGNTSSQVQSDEEDREGDGIYVKLRPTGPSRWKKQSGLWFRGYLNPLSSEDALQLLLK